MMRANFHRPSVKFFVSFLILLQASYTQAAIDACSSGVGVPPFLSSGVAPNLLMVIDNSASMYDPAYDDTTQPGYCNDDSYTPYVAETATTPEKSYGGYFLPTVRYYYDFTPAAGDFSKFKSPATTTHCTDNAAGGTVFSNNDVCIAIKADTSTPPKKTVTAFAATGNFLNWATASKLDIEKSILTGGKYDFVNKRLIAESRGCQGKRMVKEITVSSGATSYKLDLAITGANDHHTRIEIFETSTDGLNYTQNPDCQQAITETSMGQSSKYTGLCLDTTSQNADQANSNAAFNQSYQTCWGYPTVGNGDIIRSQQACGKIYNSGVNPASIDFYDTGYVCNSSYVGGCITFNTGTTTPITTCPDTTCGDTSTKTKITDNLDGTRCNYNLLEQCPTGAAYRSGTIYSCSGTDCTYKPAGTYPATCSSGYTLDTARSLCYQCPTGYTYNNTNGTCVINSCPTAMPVNDGTYCYDPNCPAGYPSTDPSKNFYDTTQKLCYTTTCADNKQTFNSSKMNACYSCSGSYTYNTTTHTCVNNKGETTTPQKSTNNQTPRPQTLIVKTPTTVAPTPGYTIPTAGCYKSGATSSGCTTTATTTSSCFDTTSGNETPWVRVPDLTKCTTTSSTAWSWNANANSCTEQALRNFCAGLVAPVVPDISVTTTLNGTTSTITPAITNLPAFLINMVSDAHLGNSIATLDGYIDQPTTPQGLLQEFSDIRMGAMKLNAEGTKAECSDTLTRSTLFNCTNDNRDGGRLITYINADNNTQLVTAINNIVADSWTPMAEAMYNAIGYYSQNSSLKLDSYDFITNNDLITSNSPAQITTFTAGKTYAGGSVVKYNSQWWRTSLGGTTMGTSPSTDQAAGGISDWQEVTYPAWANNITYSGGAIVSSADQLYQTITGGISNGSSAITDTGVTWTRYYDPITASCQSNNILIITDGSSTADQASTTTTFAKSTTVTNSGTYPADTASCGAYSGSTYLDNLAGYANSTNLFGGSKNPINTYVVAAGTLTNTGTGQCNPTTLLRDTAVAGGTTNFYPSENPKQLSNNLRKIFSSIRAGAAAGSAASVISASRGGEGAIYQAIFWPSIDDGKGKGGTVDWLGEVHSLFIDEEGSMYEDTDRNRAMNISQDQRVVLFYDESDVTPRTKACIGGQVTAGVCSGTIKELTNVKYLWSANDWLAKMFDSETKTNRNPYISSNKNRYIFTWNDLNNDGITDSGEVLPFEDRSQLGFAWNWDSLAAVSANRDLTYKDFNAANAAEANTIINWVRGDNSIAGLRTREVPALLDINNDGVKETPGVWRLGDVIYSTPVTVSKPTEAYHFLYRDFTYATFADRHKDRRHMIYFGANDGMLHAVNGGFYNVDAKKFCLAADCTQEAGKPELGAELWGYVPYNLLPHLKCLTNTAYKEKHKYFVDLRPRIFDVKIFPEEADCTASKTAAGCIHPNGWGTILVGGMRFGGTPMSAKDDLGSVVAADKRIFTSSYFILDITNPEEPPVLLGELTRTSDAAPNDQVDLGYSTVISTMVPMNVLDKTTPASSTYSWNLILGSGPTSLDGRSTQPPKIAVLPLSWLTDTPKKALRIPNSVPAGTQQAGSYTLGTATGLATTYNGFVSDMITADYNLDNFMADAVYFGTVDCRANCSDLHPIWGGTLYRLVTRQMTAGAQTPTSPSDWSGLLSGLTNPLPLIDAAQPITGAPAVATDSSNYWVYFGTGRFFDAAIDKTDTSQQSFYGIKEPMDCNRDFTWATVNKDAPSELKSGTGLTHNGTPGSQGILQVDQILVQSGSSTSPITCIPSAVDPIWKSYFNQASNDICKALVVTRTTPINTFDALTDYITGTPGKCSASEATIINKPTGTDGWYRNFNDPRERNLGQAAILGGLTSFTTYQPYNDICQSEGVGQLYSLYYQTGTAYFKPTLGLSAVSNEEPANVLFRARLGRGLATTPNLHVGTKGAKAFVQTSTGEIKEVESTNPPTPIKSGRSSWKDVR